MKKTICFLFAILLLSLLAACGNTAPAPGSDGPSAPYVPSGQAPPDAQAPSQVEEDAPTSLSVGVLNGATGMAAAWLMEEADSGRTFDTFTFHPGTAPDQMVSMLLSGQVDLAALPTNLAANLYNRSDGQIQVLAFTALGVLHLLEIGEEVHSIADLRGRTIHTTGQGANPEFILTHILTQNGLTPGVDVFIEFHANEALSAQMASGLIDLAMVPEPMASSVQMQNEAVRHVLDMTDAWNDLGDGSQLIMSAFVARRDWVEAHPAAVLRFLDLLETSINQTNANPEAVGQIIAQFEILPNATIATRAIPGCNLTFIAGPAMQTQVQGFLETLYQADPESVGGAVPGEGFFFVTQ